MKLRDRMIYAGLVTSDLKRRHRLPVREFYRDLLHVCDDHGRFEADAALLRAVLYAPILDRVSERDVEGYLQQLAAQKHGDIKLYTVRGRGYGKVTKWRQLALRKLVGDYPDEPGDPELPLGSGPEPPPKEYKKERRKEGTALPLIADESEQDWLARLQATHPTVDVRAELAACLRAKPKAGRKWFERHWLANAEPPLRAPGAPASVAVIEPEPEAWRLYLKDNYETESWADSAAACTWSDMPANWRAKIAREMKR